ncbi:MAG: hypothetical protein EU539_04075 [Promethearchaeota archaeon]|nr:MAG: hypothetical protein EU539_04075 [Candidatus Lokiarchaeota archaeon]
METIISLYLINSNYDHIKEIPESRPSSERLIDILGMRGEQPQTDIIDYFMNCAIPKVKPLVMYERNHHDRIRMGNVAPYAKTRVCLYFALHRLKLKFLIIRNFIEDFKSKNYDLGSFYDEKNDEDLTFLSVLSREYYKKNEMALNLMIQKKRVSERVKGLLNEKDSITSEKLLKMATFKVFPEKENAIKYIMREIKASIFVCKLLFAKLDLFNPFSRTGETMFDIEEIMTSNDFIPELLPAISKSLKINNIEQLDDLIRAFYFLMDRVLKGINKAIEIASGGEIQISLNESIYDTGNIFSF